MQRLIVMDKNKTNVSRVSRPFMAATRVRRGRRDKKVRVVVTLVPRTRVLRVTSTQAAHQRAARDLKVMVQAITRDLKPHIVVIRAARGLKPRIVVIRVRVPRARVQRVRRVQRVQRARLVSLDPRAVRARKPPPHADR